MMQMTALSNRKTLWVRNIALGLWGNESLFEVTSKNRIVVSNRSPHHQTFRRNPGWRTEREEQINRI
jgi:hypothetical protein